jgi:UPF0755 protein
VNQPLTTLPQKRSKAPFIGLLLLALAIAGGMAWNLDRQRKAEALRRYKWGKIALPQRLARVPARWSASTLADRLEKSRKIRDAATFEAAATQIGLTEAAPGGYLLPAVAGPLDVARVFKNGPTHEEVTFPEGFTAAQVAARLRKNGFEGAASVLQAAYPVGTPSPLEGRLFPDTYTLPLQASGTQLVQTMTERWKEEMARLPRPFPTVDGKPLTEAQIVILASLVEREAGSRAEMPLVAGVMVNRLRRPMRLQVDASIQYARVLAERGHKSRLLFADLEIKSPFNTYQNDGLPPTPICNPGAAALRAAARPAKTDALFYVYSPKLKRHLFAPDFEEHKRNIAVVRRERVQLDRAAESEAEGSE